MSWTVPSGCYYAVYAGSGTTYYYYNASSTVPTERAPNNISVPAYYWVLIDFNNGYIYTGIMNATININNNTFTVSKAETGIAGRMDTNIIASVSALSDYRITLAGSDFAFGDGSGMLNKADFLPSGGGYVMRYTFDGRTDITSVAIPSGVTNMSYCFCDCTSLTTPPTIPSSVTDMYSCFADCTSMVIAPAIPSSVTDMRYCFSNCTSLTTAPVIPNSVAYLNSCFVFCTSLVNAPAIPSSVISVAYCFGGCVSLAGNIVVSNNPSTNSSYYEKVFSGTKNDIYIVNDNAGSVWKDSIAPSYSNVHYEADDNTVPSVSMSVTRVDSALSEAQTPMGEYAYINAQVQVYEDYLPVGWSNTFNSADIKKDGTTQTVTWTETEVGLLYTLKCWINLGDIVKHTFTLQTADKIVDDNNTQKASHLSAIVTQILSKAYKLVDYYHESDQTDPNYDTEGFAIGKYATQANLFDVDMPSRFRDSVIIDRLVGEIKAYAGATVPTGWLECDGTEVAIADYPLLNNALGGDSSSGIGATLWGTASDADHFVLPNLKGKVPVGQDTADTDFSVVGKHDGGSKFIQQHSHSSSFTRPTISSGGGWSFAVTALGARSGSTTLASGWSNTTAGKSSQTRYKISNNNNTASGGTSMQDLITHSGHAHGSTGGSVSVGNINTSGLSTGSAGNLQPYAVVKYIICAV